MRTQWGSSVCGRNFWKPKARCKEDDGLPIKRRIQYKVLLLTYKNLHDLGPEHLRDLLDCYVPAMRLWSAGKLLVRRPAVPSSIGERAFSYTLLQPSGWHPYCGSVQAPALRTLKYHSKHICLWSIFSDYSLLF